MGMILWRRWKTHVEELPLARVSIVVWKSSLVHKFLPFQVKSVRGAAMRSTIGDFLIPPASVGPLVKRWRYVRHVTLAPGEIRRFQMTGNVATLYIEDDVKNMYVNVFFDARSREFLDCQAAAASEVEVSIRKHIKVRAKSVAAQAKNTKTTLVLWSVFLLKQEFPFVVASFANFIENATDLDDVVGSIVSSDAPHIIKREMIEKHAGKRAKEVFQAPLMSIGLALEAINPGVSLAKNARDLAEILYLLS